jgi:acetylornithine deacetylase
MSPDHPLVQTLANSVTLVTGQPPAVVGAPYACDLFVLQRDFDIPALVFGPSGGNAHAGDEYLELESLFAFWECLLAFVIQWCNRY